MDNKCHVGLVDAHSESVGGDHYPHTVEYKILLIFPSLLLGKSCVISCGGKAHIIELLTHIFNIFSGGAIYDAAPALLVIGGNELFQVGVFVCRTAHLKVKIFSVKARHKRKRVTKL